MIGMHHDNHGYHIVSRHASPWQRLKSQLGSSERDGVFDCYLDLQPNDILAISQCLLSGVGSNNRVSISLSPQVVGRYEFSVPATFSVKNTYTWVRQHFESWMGKPIVDSYFDFASANEGVSSKKMVTLYAVDRSYLDALLLPINKTPLSVIRVEVPELTLSRIFSSTALYKKGQRCQGLMLVDMVPGEAQVYVARSGQFTWLDSIRSPACGDTESIDMFISRLQRLIVAMTHTPSRLLLSGQPHLVDSAKEWCAAILPRGAIRGVNEISGLPCAALLAACSTLS